jgi:hypothetical protein
MYTCLFEKVSDLESRSIRAVFYYLHKKYGNSISTYLSCFKIPLCKIESIEIYFLSIFLRLTWEFLGLDSEHDTNFFMLITEIEI